MCYRTLFVPIRCIILDFDGTFTDVEREAIPFLASYRDGLAELVGAAIDDRWAEAERTVRASPDAHGFEFEGRIVAPSHADPYILAASVARLVLADVPSVDAARIEPALNELFRVAYATSDTVFRPDAGEVIEGVLALDRPVFVISNSATDHVCEKLRKLDATLLDRLSVRGGARKFHLVAPDRADARFDALAETLDLPGLSRPVYLRRGRYFEALDKVFQEASVTPEDTFVCGDIFELDLALPAALGVTTHLVTRPATPKWERDAVEASGGSWSEALSGALERLR